MVRSRARSLSGFAYHGDEVLRLDGVLSAREDGELVAAVAGHHEGHVGLRAEGQTHSWSATILCTYSDTILFCATAGL